jgi:hypothetical protein
MAGPRRPAYRDRRVEVTPEQRAEMLEEYYKLAGFVQAYDPYFVSIKSWSVTASSGLIAIVLLKDGSQVFALMLSAVAAILPLAFWVTEALFHRVQWRHVIRLKVIEEALREDRYDGPPRIITSMHEQWARSRVIPWRTPWRIPSLFREMCSPFLALPHAAFVAVGAALFIFHLFR